MKEEIELTQGFEIELYNGMVIKFKYMSTMCNPIFERVGTKYKATILDDVIYSASRDCDEPDCPLKDEYQSKFLEEYKYDFFRNTFTKKHY